jgi:hypothetical protein
MNNNEEEFFYIVYVDDDIQKINEDYEIIDKKINFKNAPKPNANIRIFKMPKYKK